MLMSRFSASSYFDSCITHNCTAGSLFAAPIRMILAQERRSETIRQGWIWTGDNAYQDSDGYFHFVDRAKDMIKRAGENVAASEVEAVILQHPKVFDCAVIGIPDPLRDEAIKAFVVLHKEEQATAEEIIEWCRNRLAKFRIPEFVEFCTELPRTSVGKIQKHILRLQEAGKQPQ